MSATAAFITFAGQLQLLQPLTSISDNDGSRQSAPHDHLFFAILAVLSTMDAISDSNRLISQVSPYLLQHARNPVDWYPWGPEALERAREEDRPILLSIGYSACHWCHVMERESFENVAIAAVMNEHFINIKVDREERPDLDEIYMMAVQAMSGSGGWPMTVFLTPDLQPFYGGTYYPPEDRHGRPGFGTVLKAVTELYRTKRDHVDEQARRWLDFLQQNAQLLSARQAGKAVPSRGDVLGGIADQLTESYDSRYGGFASAGPKFPGSMNLSILLRQYRYSGDAQLLAMAEQTLTNMARGGMYDQLGGGFHRYCVDERWLVPHFEKMLYDNALLVWVYLEAFQVTGGTPLYAEVVESTLAYVIREMTSPEGGYYSTQDADSEGEEGKFFVWNPDQFEAVLGAEQSRQLCSYFDVTEEGNFDGTSILHVDVPLPDLAASLGVDTGQLQRTVAEGKEKLRIAREAREHPDRDEKILVAWNGLMISAMARASSVLGVSAYLESATAAARFVLERMRRDDRTLLHVCTRGDGGGNIRGYQDDYACMANGLIDLFEATFDPRWLQAAMELTDSMVDLFWDAEEGGFFYTEADSSDVIVRTKNPFDNATPSGNSIATLVLLRLAALTEKAQYRELAQSTLELFSELMSQSPAACCQMAVAVDFYHDEALEIVVVGSEEDRRSLFQVVHEEFLPNKVVAGWEPRTAGMDSGGSTWGPEQASELLPLLQGRLEYAEQALAFVCRDSVCLTPIHDPAQLRTSLAAVGLQT